MQPAGREKRMTNDRSELIENEPLRGWGTNDKGNPKTKFQRPREIFLGRPGFARIARDYAGGARVCGLAAATLRQCEGGENVEVFAG
jgi:hypothetical protein